MRKKVVIIGHGFTSRLSVIRSLASLDCEISVIVMAWYGYWGRRLDTTKPIDCYSKYVNHIYYCYAKDYEGIINTLLTKCIDPFQKVAIIPDNDVSAALIDNKQELLCKHFIFPHINNTQGLVEKWMDKVRQKELAQELGLNVPTSHVIRIGHRHYEFPNGITYPCFTKTLTTIVGGKRIFKRCDNEIELRNTLDFAASLGDMPVLVEDFKKIEKEYALVGFSDGQEVVIPGILQILQMAHGSHYGVACQGIVMPIDGFEELIQQFQQLLLHIGYVGLFDIDFYKSNGKLYFGELNLRFGGSGYAVTKMGVNLPAMLVKTLMGESIDDMPKAIKGTATYVNERMCLDDWYDGYISTREYQSILCNSDISFIDDKDDPAPYKAYIRYYQKKRMKRVIKKIIGII